MKSTQPVIMVILLALSLVGAACTKPGIKATGSAQVTWGGQKPSSWVGTCSYEVQTRWATSLPHILRLESERGEALVIQSPRRFAEGRTEFPQLEERTVQGLAMDGATVRGALNGALTVSSSIEGTRIDITGVRTRRETVPFEATCRLGAETD